MKKRILSLILALMLILSATAVSIHAAEPTPMTWGENDVPLSEDNLTVTESNGTFSVKWTNPPTASKLRVYVMNGNFEEPYTQVLEPITLNYAKPFTYTIPYTHTTAEGELYQIAVVAVDSKGKEFSACVASDLTLNSQLRRWGDNEIPWSDDELTVTEKNHTFSVKWANPPTASKLRVYVSNGVFEFPYSQVLEPETFNYSKPFTYTVPYRYLTDYGCGGDLYEVAIVAVNSNGEEFLAGVASDIAFEYPTLNSPTVTLSNKGIATIDTITDASSYILSLYRSPETYSADEPELITTTTVPNSKNADGRYPKTQSVSFSSFLKDAGTYYIEAYATNPSAYWRDSAPILSNSIDISASGGYTVSGTVTSFLSATDNVTVKLDAEISSAQPYSAVTTVRGNSAAYSFSNVPAGNYLLTVSKNNHVERVEKVTVSADKSGVNVKIHPVGDINGDGIVNSTDCMRVNLQAKGLVQLNDYEKKCANVAGNDDIVNTNDFMRLNLHARGLIPLW